jgi:DNA-binding NarL/FixJ family response regulator
VIKVLVVDRSHLIGSVMTSVLKEEPDMQVVGSATSVDEAFRLVHSSNCDVVLVSTNLPDGGALDLAKELQTDSETKVVIIGVPEQQEIILQYVEAGAEGYVLRKDSEDDLLEKIRAVHAGEALISPEIAALLISRVAELVDARPSVESEMDRFAELTPREQEVLDLIGKDLSNQQIAERLVIEVGTVKNHVHSILSKLDVRSRRDAAIYWDVIRNVNEVSE